MRSVSRFSVSGFSMPELVIVIVIAGVVAVSVIPKFDTALGLRDDAWRDQVLAALRYGQKSAVAHRRLVCATVSSASISLRIASANPASSCNSDLRGPEGSASFTTGGGSSASTAVSPAGIIYFQPDGRVTSDGAGATASSRTVSMSGVSSITVNGETGYVE